MKSVLKCFSSLCKSSKSREKPESKTQQVSLPSDRNAEIGTELKTSGSSPHEGSLKQIQQRKLLAWQSEILALERIFLLDFRSLTGLSCLKKGMIGYKFSYSLQNKSKQLIVIYIQWIRVLESETTISWENLTSPSLFRTQSIKYRKLHTVEAKDIMGVIYGPDSSTFKYLLQNTKRGKIEDWKCVSIITKRRSYDFYLEDEGKVENFILGLQTILIRRDRKFPIFMLGRIIWKRVNLRLRYEARKKDDSVPNLIWKKFLQSLIASQGITHPVPIVTLKEFIYRKRIHSKLFASFQKACQKLAARNIETLDIELFLELLTLDPKEEDRSVTKALMKAMEARRFKNAPDPDAIKRSFPVRKSICQPRINNIFGVDLPEILIPESEQLQQEISFNESSSSDSSEPDEGNDQVFSMFMEKQRGVYQNLSKLDINDVYNMIGGTHKKAKRRLRQLQNNYRRMEIMKMVLKRQVMNLDVVAPNLLPKPNLES